MSLQASLSANTTERQKTGISFLCWLEKHPIVALHTGTSLRSLRPLRQRSAESKTPCCLPIRYLNFESIYFLYHLP